MSGLLADLYSAGDRMKRKLGGLLSNPLETVALGSQRMAEDVNALTRLASEAGYMPNTVNRADQSVLVSERQKALARALLADKGAEMGANMIGATVWHGSPQNMPASALNGRIDMQKANPQEDALRLAKELEKLTEDHGTLYVRWSPSMQGDLQPGRVSRDFVSGQSHAGLSASPITPDMHHVDILKRVNEYNFLGPSHRPHIYKAQRVGTDSDGYASIAGLQPIREFSDKEIKGLRSGWSKVLDLADEVQRAKSKIEQSGGKSSIWEERLKQSQDALEAALAKFSK